MLNQPLATDSLSQSTMGKWNEKRETKKDNINKLFFIKHFHPTLIVFQQGVCTNWVVAMLIQYYYLLLLLANQDTSYKQPRLLYSLSKHHHVGSTFTNSFKRVPPLHWRLLQCCYCNPRCSSQFVHPPSVPPSAISPQYTVLFIKCEMKSVFKIICFYRVPIYFTQGFCEKHGDIPTIYFIRTQKLLENPGKLHIIKHLLPLFGFIKTPKVLIIYKKQSFFFFFLYHFL